MSSSALAANEVVTLSVENMTCKMCDITVRKAIKQVDGVIEASVDYKSKIALVTFNPDRTTVATIEKASTMAGYPATVKPE